MIKVIPRLLFITDRKFWNAPHKGGVQLCTEEYFALFEKAGFHIKSYEVDSTSSIYDRLLIKAKLDTFNHYDFKKIAKSVRQIIEEENITYIAINQINLAPLAPALESIKLKSYKLILLSHGNETGDYLPYLTRVSRSKLSRLIHAFRLGRILLRESELFTNHIDLVLCISEFEISINKWLGAENIFFVPRSFNPSFLDWQPELGKIGFVGTLDHFPNLKGLELLFNALQKLTLNKDLKIQIVGSGSELGRKLEKDYSFVEYLGRLDEEELKNIVKTWSIFLNPVFWYSRGASTKLAVAINWGIPLLSTVQGNRGYKWKDGELETCNSPEDMATRIVEYSNDKQKLGILAQQSRIIAKNGFTLEEIASTLREKIASL